MGDDNQPKGIAPKPLVCLPGARPEGLPYIENESCGVKDAREAYRQLEESYEQKCEEPSVCDSYLESGAESPISQECRDLWTQCGVLRSSFPIDLRRQGSAEIDHPFMNVIYNMDPYGIDDFRSGSVFANAASDPALVANAKKTGHMTLLYPASGSHMTPFLTVLKLVDQGALRTAKIIYTEIEESKIARVEEYLQFLSSGDSPVLKMEGSTKKLASPGHEMIYHLSYRGTPIEFVFGMNRGGDVYSPDEYIREADLVIFHDSVHNENSEKSEDAVADNFFLKLAKYSVGSAAKQRFVLTENQWKCLPREDSCWVGRWSFPTRHFQGQYGCGGINTSPVWYRAVADPQARDGFSLKKGEGAPSGNITGPYVHGSNLYGKKGHGAVLFTVPVGIGDKKQSYFWERLKKLRPESWGPIPF